MSQGSVYEKLFETSDIMSDAFKLCVGHFHFVLDFFLFDISLILMNLTGNIFLNENDDILAISCPIFKQFSPFYSTSGTW